MPLDVSQVDRSFLSHSPLTSVICQIRFDANPQAGDARVIQELRERLGGEAAFPHIDQISEGAVSISVGANIAPVTQQISTTGWRLRDKDGSRAISLLPSSVALEVFRYEGWDDFVEQLDVLLRAVEECVRPVFEQRLGLRYINQLTVPEVHAPQEWRGFIDDSLLGIGSHEEVGPLVIFTRQQAVIQVDEEARCTLNQGFAPDEGRERALTYVLDFDVSREGTRTFDRDDIRDCANRFNTYVLRLFQIATTAELRALMAR